VNYPINTSQGIRINQKLSVNYTTTKQKLNDKDRIMAWPLHGESRKK